VDTVKASEANHAAQSEAHRVEIKDLKKKLAEKNEYFEVAKAKQEISEWTSARLQKNVDKLRESKERYYEKSLDCAKKLKDSFAKVGAYSSKQKKLLEVIPKGLSNGSVKKLKLLKRSSATMAILRFCWCQRGCSHFGKIWLRTR
jgi:hypothetical protein